MSSTEVALRATYHPVTLAERLLYAEKMSEAGMLPEQYRRQSGNVLVAMAFGESLGIPMIQAMSSVNVIDGKPSASAALISMLVRRAGHRLRVTGDDTTATATIIRSDDPDFTYTSTWTPARAQHAGLCVLGADGTVRARSQRGKVLPWEAYTAALLKARAVTEVARDACQEALMGVQYTPEELGALVNEAGDIIPSAEPVEESRRVTPTAGAAATRVRQDRRSSRPQATVQAPASAEPEQEPVNAEIVPDMEPLPAEAAPEAVDADPAVEDALVVEDPPADQPEPEVAPHGRLMRPVIDDAWWLATEQAEITYDLEELARLGTKAAAAGHEHAISHSRAAYSRAARQKNTLEGR